MRIKNVFNPDGLGTTITTSSCPAFRSSSQSTRSSGCKIARLTTAKDCKSSQEHRPRPTALTSRDDVVILNLSCARDTKSALFLKTIFGKLADYNISVDLVTVSEKNISIAVDTLKHGDTLTMLVEEIGDSGVVSISMRFLSVQTNTASVRLMWPSPRTLQ
jgi:aspartate kinase